MTEFSRVSMSTELIGPIKQVLKDNISIEWNEYELETLVYLVIRCIEGYSKKGFIPTHLELYEIVGWDLACAPSTVQSRIKKSKDKIFKNPFVQGILTASGTQVNQVTYDMFFKMIINTATIAQQQSNILNLTR